MPEAAKQLHHALEDLKRALDSSEAVDPGVRQRLDRAVAEIHAAIIRLPESADQASTVESPGPTTNDSDESLAGQLSEVARDFEASHPTLSGIVGSVIDALARMGI